MILIRKFQPSAGAVALRNALREAGHTCKFTDKSRFAQRHLILNWGGEDDPHAPNSRLLNQQSARRVALNKLTAFTVLSAAGVNIPQVFTSAQDAADFRASLSARTNPIILARRTATGQGGEGITVVRMGEDIPAGCAMYSSYIRKHAEYRVHVVMGQAIAVQQKRRRTDQEGNETTADNRDAALIRNFDNGWVFCTEAVDEHADAAKAIAVQAADALSLDVAAVDVIRCTRGQMYVLEANTKPGLDSPTVLAAYVNALTRLHP